MPALPRRAFLRSLGAAAGWVAAAGAARTAGAQGVAAGPRVYRARVDLVVTPVTVTDASGRLVVGLSRDDFALFEDGRPQRLAQFTRDRVPVSLALALDVSDSMTGRRLADAHAALARFLDELLAPGDEAALLLFNHRPQLVAPWTTERSRVHERLRAVRPQGGTALYDAIAAALPLFDDRAHPRAALVVISDGADTASDTTVASLRARLLRTDAFVYAIAIDAPDARPSARVNPHVLRELAGQTGGDTALIADSADLVPATARIAEELNHQYMLGYTPDRPPDGTYRAIRVRVRSSDYRVRSRRGYVAMPPS